MANVDISAEQARSLRQLTTDDYLFRQLRHDEQLALTGIVSQLPVLEDGIYTYTVAGSSRVYFVKEGMYALEISRNGLEGLVNNVPSFNLEGWTRIADLPA